MEKLKHRNYQLLRENNPAKHRIWYQGLSVPMTSAERQVRRRIRRKVTLVLFELDLISKAGVEPNREMRKEGIKNIQAMLDKIGFYVFLGEMAEEEKNNQNSSEGFSDG